MFSIEKHYMREQQAIIKKFQHKLDETKELLQSYKAETEDHTNKNITLLQEQTQKLAAEIQAFHERSEQSQSAHTEATAHLQKELHTLQDEYTKFREATSQTQASEKQEFQDLRDSIEGFKRDISELAEFMEKRLTELQEQHNPPQVPQETDTELLLADDLQEASAAAPASPDKLNDIATEIDAEDTELLEPLEDPQNFSEPDELEAELEGALDLEDSPEESAAQQNTNTSPELAAVPESPPIYELLFPRDLMQHADTLHIENYYTGVQAHVALLQIYIYSGATLQKLAPQSQVKLYNKLFQQILSCITEHYGTISAYSGDAVTAAFGLLKESTEDASRALYAVFAIHEKLQLVNEYLALKGVDAFSCAVALHKADLVVGEVGRLRPRGVLLLGEGIELVRHLALASVEKSLPLCSENFVEAIANKSVFEESFAVEIPGKSPVTVYPLRESS